MKIVITGGSGGIGSQLSEHFDQKTNFLFISYNTKKKKVFEPIRAEFAVAQCDFTNEKEVINFYKSIDVIDVLINVMGTVANSLIVNMTYSQWKSVIESNLNSVFLSCKYAIPKMKNNSRIINISSILGTTGMIGASNYVAAKGGVESFTKSLALELIRDKIFVNGIALGYFEVGMGLGLSQKIIDITKKKIPLHSFGTIKDIINTIEFLIENEYIVGQIIHINGGLRI